MHGVGGASLLVLAVLMALLHPTPAAPGGGFKGAGALVRQPEVALTLALTMLYGGTALGSVVGGAAGAGLGFGNVAWAGLPFLALGLLTLRWRPQG